MIQTKLTFPRLFFFWVVLFRVTLFCENDNSFPHCELYGDTVGKWVRTNEIENSQQHQQIESHFILGGAKEALNFSQIWLPENCAYHRFTNASIVPVVSRALHDKNRANGRYRIAIIGDSGSRGIFCGLTRILSGSELYGPCSNAVCGTAGSLPATFKTANHIYDTDFSPQLRISFEYIFGLDNHHGDWALEFMIKAKPDVLVFNTGAWDFDKIARTHMNETAAAICNSEETFKVSRYRSSDHILDMLKELSGYAKAAGVRVIYRNNHHNSRFGALCADANFEPLVKQVGWEVWDNRRVAESDLRWLSLRQTQGAQHSAPPADHSLQPRHGLRSGGTTGDPTGPVFAQCDLPSATS